MSIVFALIYYWLIPEIVLDVDRAELVLVVPKTIAESSVPSNLLLVRLSPDGNHNVFEINGSTMVNVGQYGSYQLAMVYPLLQLDDHTDQFVNSVFSQLFQITMDKVVALDPVSADGSWSVLFENQLKQQPMELLWWQLAYIQRTSEKSMEEPILLTDMLDRMTKSWSVISSEQSQKCPIAVSNGTNVSGLATYSSDLIEKAGGLVIRVATDFEKQDTTTVIVSPSVAECQEIAKKIGQFFPSAQISIDTQDLTSEYRAKILVLLGQDMDSFTPTADLF
jgi:hypothetical protein